MKPRLSLSLAAALVLAAPAPSQTAPAQGLLEPGDILSNGEEVDFVRSVHVHDSGVWAMHVSTTTPGRAVVRNGQVVMAEGDVISTGETVTFIDFIDMSPSGVLAFGINVEDAGGSVRGIIYTLGLPWVAELDQFPDPYGSPDPYVVRGIQEIAVAYPYMAFNGSVAGGGDPLARQAVVVYDFSAPLSPVVQVLAENGRTAPGGGTFGNPRDTLDVLQDGRVLASTTVDGDDAFLFDQVIVARDGQTAPDAAYRWNILGRAAVSSAGHLMLSGSVDFASTGLLAGDRIFVDGVMRVDEGQPFGSGTSGPYFYRGLVDRSGRLHFVHDAPTTSGYAIDGDVLMEEGLASVDGETVTAFGTLDLEAISDSGRYVILSPGIPSAPGVLGRLALLETDMGNDVASCPTVPNSTGAVSTLGAVGSSKIGVGAFPMTAYGLPPGQPGLLVCSTTSAVTMNPAGSQGNLCVGGAIGRFMGQIGFSSAGGTLGITVDAEDLPQPGGLVPAQAGEVWGFQLWHRDFVGGAPTSNFGRPRAIAFR